MNPEEIQQHQAISSSKVKKMKVLIQCLLLVCLLCGWAVAGSRQELQPQHAEICKRVSTGSDAVVLTTQDIQKNFSAFDESVELKHDYLVCGKDKSKPPVILLHEMPGLETLTLNYAMTLSEDFTVYVPLLMGDVYRDNLLAGWWDYVWADEWEQKPELQGSTLLTQWLRKFAAEIGRRHPQQTIGIIGNCLTGTLPLALLDNPQVTRVVLAQPTLPMKTLIGLGDKEDLAISQEEWNTALNRINPKDSTPTAKAYGTRFERDGLAPVEKYEYLKRRLGPGFLARQIAGGEYRVLDGNNTLLFEIPEHAHSSLIHDWKDIPNHPSEIRRREIKAFLKSSSLR